MCGFYLHFSHNVPLDLIDIDNLRKGLHRRGPDNFGIKLNSTKKLLLAHSRLAIQDLSHLASQPMKLKDSNLTILFNGEVYNNFYLRKNYLREIHFETDSDSETIIRLIDKYGIERAFSLIDGMISIVLFSEKENAIYFYRDSSAQKPLFYAFSKDKKSFATTTNPSLIYKLNTSFKKEYDNDQLLNYFSCNFTEPRKTLYKSLFTCESGLIYRINLNELNLESSVSIINNSPNYIINSSNQEIYEKTTESIISSLIGARSCGILLSGGVDSTAVAVAASKLNKIKRAYTLFLPEDDDPELLQSQETASELNFEHIPIELNAEGGIEVINNLSEIIDYPNPDPSIICSYLVAKEASKKDTILLTGDGGDEIFGGYNRYKSLITKYGYIFKFLPLKIKLKILKNYLNNFATNLGSIEIDIDFTLRKIVNDNSSLLMNLCAIDQKFYMAQHTLPKTDRAFMYFSLEGRAPLLNNFFKGYSKKFLEISKRSTEKIFLRNYIKENIGNVYSYRAKKGFSGHLDKLSKNKEFIYLLKEKIIPLDDIFQEFRTKLNYDYFLKLISPNHSCSKRDLRIMWHLLSFISCDKNYG